MSASIWRSATTCAPHGGFAVRVAQDGQCAVGVRDDERCLAAEPLSVEIRDRRRRDGLAPLELDRAEHVVVPVDLAPLAFDELDDEVGACAPELVRLHFQSAVVERGELGGDVRREVATRAPASTRALQ